MPTSPPPPRSNVPAAGNRTRWRPWLSRLRRDATILAWHAWQRLDAVLPRTARYALATGLGDLIYWALPNKRAAVLENMTHVLGPGASPAEVRRVARRSFRNFAKYLAEFTHLPRWTLPDLQGLVTRNIGWENVESALAEGKGAIFVTCHFGNWDVAGWYYGQHHSFQAIVEPLNPPELDTLVQGWRRAKGMGTIPLANAARGVLRSLHAGGVVAIVVDRPVHARGEEGGVPVRFFGAWTRVPAGAARFALRSGAPVVAAGVRRTPRNTFEAFSMPPRHFYPSADPAQRAGDAARAMQAIMEDMDEIVRRDPDQWYMFRRMWPGPPAAAPARHAPAPQAAPLNGRFASDAPVPAAVPAATSPPPDPSAPR